MTTTRQRAVYFHIGGPKTGTTYLQAILHRNRELLRENGLLYPGEKKPAHYWASQDLCGVYFQGHANPNVDGAWLRLVDEIGEWDGRALIDHELFVNASDEAIERAMHDLSQRAGAQVHLVWTARDLARQIPAAWQEHIKNRATTSYADYLARVRNHAEDDRMAAAFWRQHGTPGILERWSRALPPERVHVVTVPPSGSDSQLLWRRFAGLLGLEPEIYDTDTGRTNSSLGAAEATVVRRLNEVLADLDVSWPVYSNRLKFGAVNLMAEASHSARIELPADVYEWAVEWSDKAVAELAGKGYDVVGDLQDLIPRDRQVGADPDTVPASELADAAVAGMAALIRLPGPNWRVGARPVDAHGAGSSEPLGERPSGATHNAGPPPARQAKLEAEFASARAALQAHAQLAPGARIMKCFAELADQVRWIRAVRRGYRRLRGRSLEDASSDGGTSAR